MPSADDPAGNHADLSFHDLVQAYFDCRQAKRNTASAIAFEAGLERNLSDLYDELVAGTYRPGRSICFVVTRPKPREVWAADFRDRIVHHLLYNRVAPRFHAAFIADSCACIPGRGTLYAAQRLEAKIRSVTRNWSRPAHYLKLDLANFFVSIDKRVLHDQLASILEEVRGSIILNSEDLPDIAAVCFDRLWHEHQKQIAKLLGRTPNHEGINEVRAEIGKGLNPNMILVACCLIGEVDPGYSFKPGEDPARMRRFAERHDVDAQAIKASLQKVQPKTANQVHYRYPGNDAATWSGKGKKPRWVEDWLATGHTLEEIEVAA